ncbi:MAG: prepilin-type N-terminal cleavage/methylation domain-containing protein [Candidatus Omnitrophica bacterium]|nr:prepilin-type N-terminal cleavage/methylation domain-containing protein [Candidatus Omnitrophota bacterium]
MADPADERRSYTLVEVMVVIVMLSVVAGIAIPFYTQVVDNSKAKTAQNTLILIRHAKLTYERESNFDLPIEEAQYNDNELWGILKLDNPNTIHADSGYRFYATESGAPEVVGVAHRTKDDLKYRIRKSGEMTGAGLPPIN